MNEQLNSPNSFRSSFSECSQVLSVADESSANNYHQHQDNIIDIEQRPEKEHQELEVTGTSTEEQEEPSDKDESNPGSVNNKILISKRVIRTRQSSRMCLNASEEGQWVTVKMNRQNSTVKDICKIRTKQVIYPICFFA